MSMPRFVFTAFAVPLALAAWMPPDMGAVPVDAQASGMGASPSKVDIPIHDQQHGYETVGFTMPSHDTIIVVHNVDTVTHGFASRLFKDIPVRTEGGVEVVGGAFRSFHVDPGKTMTLRFAAAPSHVRSVDGRSRERAALHSGVTSTRRSPASCTSSKPGVRSAAGDRITRLTPERLVAWTAEGCRSVPVGRQPALSCRGARSRSGGKAGAAGAAGNLIHRGTEMQDDVGVS
jgi:hypothetical protein